MRWGEDGGALSAKLQNLKLKLLAPLHWSFREFGVFEVRGKGCLLPFSLDPPFLGYCPSTLALSRLKTTFSGCGMNNLLQFVEFCYPKMA